MSVLSEARDLLRAGLGRGPGRGIFGIAVLALGAGWLASGPRGDSPEPVAVRRGDLVLTVEVEGELAALRSAEIGPPAAVEAELKIAFLAPEGGQVKKGDPVVGFDAQVLERQLDEKRAELAEAEQKIEQKRTDLQMKALELDQLIAQAEADFRKAELKAEVPPELQARVEVQKAALERSGRQRDLENLRAQREAARVAGDAEASSLGAQRDRARGRVAELQAAIERLTVRAPQDGIVIHNSDWRDEKKKVGDNVWSGETILSLPDLSEMRADGTVDEADGALVEVGQPVNLRLEARADLDLRGRVRSIARAVRRKSWRVPAKVFKVEIALERTDPTVMRPAMRFRAEIETGRLPGRLLIPREAVFLRDGGPVVFVSRWLRSVETRVALGLRNRSLVEVVDGLGEGDRVVPVDLGMPPAERSRDRVSGR